MASKQASSSIDSELTFDVIKIFDKNKAQAIMLIIKYYFAGF
jgi:hypothetical protein